MGAHLKLNIDKKCGPDTYSCYTVYTTHLTLSALRPIPKFLSSLLLNS